MRRLLPPAEGSISAGNTLSTQLSELNERVKPATAREIAIELEKLRAVFGYELGAWNTASSLYFDALRDLPYDLLRDAISTCIRTAGPDDRFPKPGAIRAIVADVLETRKTRLKRAQTPKGDDVWPRWLAEIWGPLPDGMVARNRAIAAGEQHKLDIAKRHTSSNKPMPADPAQLLTELGVTATLQRMPKHEDPDELRRGRIELGLEDEILIMGWPEDETDSL